MESEIEKVKSLLILLLLLTSIFSAAVLTRPIGVYGQYSSFVPFAVRPPLVSNNTTIPTNPPNSTTSDTAPQPPQVQEQQQRQTTPVNQNDSIRSYFTTTGGIDESLDPNNPKGEDNVDGERPDYAFLASLFSVTEPTPGQLVQAAENNTDIDVEKIRESARESLGDLIYLRTFLAMGDIEAARFFTSKIDRQMLDVGMEVGFTRPVEQMILVEGSIDDEAAAEEEGEGSNVSNSGQLIAELEQLEQQAIEEGRLPPNPTYTTLNASDINELALDARGRLGVIAYANSNGDQAQVTAYTQELADILLDMYYMTNFAVPLEQVRHWFNITTHRST
jgi:hypothetical protein